MKKIKIAQIGIGHDHAADVMTVLKQQNDNYELVGYCSVPEDSLNVPEFAYEGHKSAYDGVSRLSLEEILNYPELEAVCIETEDRVLTKYALIAAEKGLHIHMDKAGGVSDAEFDKLINMAEKKQLVFHMGYMYRYNPAVMKMKRDIADGKLGNIISVEAQMNCCHGDAKRKWLESYPGGMMYFLGCHMIDLIDSIMGIPLETVPFNCSSNSGVSSDDFGMAVLKYKNGVSLAKSTAVEAGGGRRRQLVAVGTKGTAEIMPLECGVKCDGVFVPFTAEVRETLKTENGEKTEIFRSEVFGRYDAMMSAFADYVRGMSQNPYSYEYEKNLHKLLLGACGMTAK